MRTSAVDASSLVEGGSVALVGLGALMLALFPLAIPLIALTTVALIPFLVVALAIGLAAAAFAAHGAYGPLGA
jgi:hypothetical protein